MSEPDLLHSESDGVLTVTFNRPQKYNALTFAMLDQLQELADKFREDDSLRVLLITGNGKYYSAGMDISAGLAPETDSGIEFRNWYRTAIHQLFDELEAIEKPIISAAQGPCLGGALEMALSCDFRLAAESAAYGLPETNIGALPGSGGTSRLTRLVGVAEAKWLIMAAQTIDAQRALRVGLVHEVYPDAEFLQRCQAFARHLASLPREVLGMAKLTIESVKDLDRASARNIERMANTQLSQSQEHRDLVAKFLARK
jgi:enoyl-CoA hydratase/carnithine racemase